MKKTNIEVHHLSHCANIVLCDPVGSLALQTISKNGVICTPNDFNSRYPCIVQHYELYGWSMYQSF